MLRRWLRLGRRAPDAGSEPDGSPASRLAEVNEVTKRPEPPGPDRIGIASDPVGLDPVASSAGRPGPEERVRALLGSDAVSAATRIALTARLDALHRPPIVLGRSLSAEEVATLRAATDRLIPQADRDRPVDLVAAIDARLAADRGDGWRYDALPADGESLRRGLAGLDEAARELHALGFAGLAATQQDDVLRLVQTGNPPGDVWRTLPAGRWFEDLLAECCETYYADPISEDEIGYVGYADLPSWQAIGLDQREDRERDAVPATPHMNGRPDGV